MLRVTILILAITHQAFTQPSRPPAKFPDNWYAEFSESLQLPKVGSGTTTGKWWYSYEKNASRVERENGRYDGVCGTTMPNKDTKCSDLVVNGNRYLHFPKVNYCCKCCDASQGCGILRNDLVQKIDFRGQEVIKGGVKTNAWQVVDHGILKVFYQDLNGKMVRIDEQGLSDMYYDMITYSEREIADDVFAVPSGNCNKYCPQFSFCTVFRKNLVSF